jgi:hypothetical protein
MPRRCAAGRTPPCSASSCPGAPWSYWGPSTPSRASWPCPWCSYWAGWHGAGHQPGLCLRALGAPLHLGLSTSDGAPGTEAGRGRALPGAPWRLGLLAGPLHRPRALVRGHHGRDEPPALSALPCLRGQRGTDLESRLDRSRVHGRRASGLLGARDGWCGLDPGARGDGRLPGLSPRRPWPLGPSISWPATALSPRSPSVVSSGTCCACCGRHSGWSSVHVRGLTARPASGQHPPPAALGSALGAGRPHSPSTRLPTS